MKDKTLLKFEGVELLDKDNKPVVYVENVFANVLDHHTTLYDFEIYDCVVKEIPFANIDEITDEQWLMLKHKVKSCKFHICMNKLK